MASIDLAAMRERYTLSSLTEHELPSAPHTQFDRWLEQAVESQQPEPNAMTLATTGSDLRPNTRIVLLKGHDARGLVWFTNYESRKAHDIAGNPYAALQFYWATLQRVVRVEGIVEKTSAADSDQYFSARPLGSRIGAIASPQSQVVANRQVLEEAFERIEKEVADSGQPPVRPQSWGGYRLVPQRWEFWQGRDSRLHDRLCYVKNQQNEWQIERLAP